MDWYQAIFIILANGSLIAWFRAESRADWRHIDAKTDAFYASMRDFHGRLCDLESRKSREANEIKSKAKK